jgi:hypothetical protein
MVLTGERLLERFPHQRLIVYDTDTRHDFDSFCWLYIHPHAALICCRPWQSSFAS